MLFTARSQRQYSTGYPSHSDLKKLATGHLICPVLRLSCLRLLSNRPANQDGGFALDVFFVFFCGRRWELFYFKICPTDIWEKNSDFTKPFLWCFNTTTTNHHHHRRLNSTIQPGTISCGHTRWRWSCYAITHRDLKWVGCFFFFHHFSFVSAGPKEHVVGEYQCRGDKQCSTWACAERDNCR